MPVPSRRRGLTGASKPSWSNANPPESIHSQRRGRKRSARTTGRVHALWPTDTRSPVGGISNPLHRPDGAADVRRRRSPEGRGRRSARSGFGLTRARPQHRGAFVNVRPLSDAAPRVAWRPSAGSRSTMWGGTSSRRSGGPPLRDHPSRADAGRAPPSRPDVGRSGLRLTRRVRRCRSGSGLTHPRWGRVPSS